MSLFEPIGFFQTIESERYALPRQPGNWAKSELSNEGKIFLNPDCNYEEALKDLEGFDRIFVIYHFHKNKSWKPKVFPPRGDKKRGVFATRSPHRPNFLGLSCLQLKKIEGLTLTVVNHDLLNGTPIFDIKPYLVYADCFPDAKQGWLENLQQETLYQIKWGEEIEQKFLFLENENIELISNITPRLKVNPFPTKSNRIRLLENGEYEIAYKSWRIRFSLDHLKKEISLEDVYSGYDFETVSGIKSTHYLDLSSHLKFISKFQVI